VERTDYPDGVDPDDLDSVMRGLTAGAFHGSVLTERAHENVGRVTDLSLLLTAIEQVVPRPAVAFIEGTRISDEVRTLLDERSIPSGRDDLWGTAWPRPEGFHLPLTDENMRDLRQLVSSHTRPEDPYPFAGICDHVVVDRDHEIVLAAYDVGSDVWLSRDLPAGTVELFQEVAGAIY
jgi:hypothetical protein